MGTHPQLDLLSRGTARTTDPETSLVAGAKAAGDHDRQSDLILRALVALIRPSTAGEIASYLTAWTSTEWTNVKVSRRLAKMREDGLIGTYAGDPLKPAWPKKVRDGQCLHEATEQGRRVAQRAA